MKTIGDLEAARGKVEADIAKLLRQVAALVMTPYQGADEGIALLRQLRREVYEDINQIQHEGAILSAVEWLVNAKGYDAETLWEWHPRQTGPADEPDLRGIIEGHVVISAEVTTSASPKGVIDKRMAHTLTKLGQMEGDRFYFVVSPSMHKRASTKVKIGNFGIEVVNLVVPIASV